MCSNQKGGNIMEYEKLLEIGETLFIEMDEIQTIEYDNQTLNSFTITLCDNSSLRISVEKVI